MCPKCGWNEYSTTFPGGCTKCGDPVFVWVPRQEHGCQRRGSAEKRPMMFPMSPTAEPEAKAGDGIKQQHNHNRGLGIPMPTRAVQADADAPQHVLHQHPKFDSTPVVAETGRGPHCPRLTLRRLWCG
eukprot:CAMPEP_0174340278 /NCGR_PEP_ID=MMETSP0810-20121108/24562_1 /TAXON_ID=73025 ORGANISM="Eutreptiella gymnastica-like, Strain CCMP1594" /NCGR_SAMPLE_ID=MMETSP0810 /ASSEMBLY_ACC=CAM_ASM_000659 /LENGTH=127 /DNA_ID=CAMNT_0015461375 /DNA_START=52 /DNA_END=436 /DNA_ORIENTATION=+